MLNVAETDWADIQALFEELVDLAPDEQTRRLTKSKYPAPVIKQAADLLAATRSDGILDMAPPPIDQPSAKSSYASLSPGQEVGGFTIQRLIGRGGMGEVYLALRTSDDFEQRVALKLLRAEVADRGDAFMRERRLLARLEHPGIARLIDAGIAPDGRPYMAMEYVDGVPIDQYCRDHKADLETRLNQFRAVCDAVSYAHGKLIVHRDIKPSNVMIDQDGKVRLLDFGIAKLLGESAAIAATTQAMLTPDYAAPEQLDGDDATVVTDVYALGVVLYELVSGKGPWQRDGASVPAIIRRVLYEDPLLPSHAAATNKGHVPSAQIAGDLDAIIMKAMRRNPVERYRSVADLSADIGRHQQLKPVHARDGTTRYMLGRFVRRFRWAVAASTAAIAALLIGAGGIAWQARQTAIERDIALAEVRRSDATNRLVTTLFREPTNSGKLEGQTVRQLLDDAAANLIRSVDKSQDSAELVLAIAVLYIYVDDQLGAETLLEKALAAKIGEADPVSTARLRLRLASVKAVSNDIAESKRLVSLAEPVFAKDAERFPVEMIDVSTVRAVQARREGDTDTALRLITGILPKARIVLKADARELVRLHNVALSIMIQAKRLDGFPAMMVRTRAILKATHQERSLIGIDTMQNQGMYLLMHGDQQSAEKLLNEVVTIRRTLFGESGTLSTALDYLADAEMAAGKRSEAIQMYTEAQALGRKYYGPTSSSVILPTLKLSLGYLAIGDAEKADGALALIESDLLASPEHTLRYGDLLVVRGQIRSAQGRWPDANTAFDRAQAIFTAGGPRGKERLNDLIAVRLKLENKR